MGAAAKLGLRHHDAPPKPISRPDIAFGVPQPMLLQSAIHRHRRRLKQTLNTVLSN